MPLSILELSIIEISSNHGCSMTFSAVVNPLPIVVVPVAPCVNTLPMFFVHRILAFILIAIFVFHATVSFVFAIHKTSLIG